MPGQGPVGPGPELAGQEPVRQEPAGQDGQAPKPSYYVRNPWRPWISGAFAGGSTILTVTTVFYALGRLPLALVGISAMLAAAVFAFGHGIALVLLGRAVRGMLDLASLAALLVGTLLFAGALVSRHLFGGPSFFAPWGGMLTMLGWLLQAVAALRR